MDETVLTLTGLYERHPGLTPALADSYTEAACVCLHRHHQPPVNMVLTYGDNSGDRMVNFEVPDNRILNAHANEIDATEMGAYAMSLAAVEAVAGLVAVRRAATLTGADWYIAPSGTDFDDLEDCIRLEVSGVNAGVTNEVKRRLNEKLAQAARGASNLPAIAAVVGFRAKLIAFTPLGVGK